MAWGQVLAAVLFPPRCLCPGDGLPATQPVRVACVLLRQAGRDRAAVRGPQGELPAQVGGSGNLRNHRLEMKGNFEVLHLNY